MGVTAGAITYLEEEPILLIPVVWNLGVWDLGGWSPVVWIPDAWDLAVWVLALLLAGALCGLSWSRWAAVRRMARTRRLGSRGERRARRLLVRAGYRVVAAQVSARMVVLVDGGEREFSVRADLLVAKRRRRYVVEVEVAGETFTGPAGVFLTAGSANLWLLELP